MEVMVFSDSKYVVESVDKKWVFSWEKNNLRERKTRFVETISINASKTQGKL